MTVSSIHNDEYYMQQALELAHQAYGHVSPNPYVGAVLVKNHKIIGKGFHARAGEAHAEVNAVLEAESQGYSTEGATLYVTLEPCSHVGRTPPCTKKIIESGIKRVVLAMRDPNPKVNGSGVLALEQAGIAVTQEVCKAQAEALNRIFIHNQLNQRPFVALKTALSLDGKSATASGESQWITGESARLQAHYLRQGYDAILIGHHTVNRDNPALTVRHPQYQKPLLRIVLCRDPKSVNLNQQIFNTDSAPTWLAYVDSQAELFDPEPFQQQGVELLSCPSLPSGMISPHDLMQQLWFRGVRSVLLEGGAGLHNHFLNAGCVDWLYLFQAPLLIGGSGAALWSTGTTKLNLAPKLIPYQETTLGVDRLLEGALYFPKHA